MVPTTPLGGTVEYDYQNSLPPDLRRAAPELYRNCRRTGSGTVRGLVKDVVDKEHDDYASLWDGGTIADFEIAKCKTAQDLHQLLATSDALEILFRRIASHMHLKKTGDHQGAQDMLAVKAPSMKSELAPDWLLDEVASRGQAEYKTSQRAAASTVGRDGNVSFRQRGGGGYGDRGRGGGDRGRGGGRGPEAPAGGDDAPAARGRGGGRGRGGRRGH
jgi:hypothetical protein